MNRRHDCRIKIVEHPEGTKYPKLVSSLILEMNAKTGLAMLDQEMD